MSVDIRISRHDPHNLEVKTHFPVPAPFAGETDFYLFLPQNFHAAAVRKDKLRDDFLSRSRLAVSIPPQVELQALRQELEQLLVRIRTEKSVELARRFAAHASEILRVLGKRQKQQLYRSPLEEVPAHFQSLYRWVHEIRDNMAGRSADGNENALIKLLDEYLSYLFVKYLADLKEFAAKVPGAGGVLLHQTWSELEAKEKEYWQERGFGAVANPSGYAQEQHLIRLSHLKKFFQSKMFVNIEQGGSAEKLAEPLAAVSAGGAALWVAFVQGSLGNHPAEVGFGSGAVLTSAAFGYMMRDRIKDWGKAYFMKKARHFLPDRKQRLFVEKEEIGRTKDWLRVVSREAIDASVESWRRKSSLSDLENELPEDVLHYRVERAMKPKTLPGLGRDWAFQEVLRINLNRYLKGLDDPFKEVTTFDPVGQLTRHHCHRTYPVTLVTVSRSTFGDVPHATRHLVHRIWLDKTGIDRVERVFT